jgi:hypothetical protein
MQIIWIIMFNKDAAKDSNFDNLSFTFNYCVSKNNETKEMSYCSGFNSNYLTPYFQEKVSSLSANNVDEKKYEAGSQTNNPPNKKRNFSTSFFSDNQGQKKCKSESNGVIFEEYFTLQNLPDAMLSPEYHPISDPLDNDSSESQESQKVLKEISELEDLERSLDSKDLSEIGNNNFYFTPSIDLNGKTDPNHRFPDIINVFPEIPSNGLHLLDGTLNAHLIPDNASEMLKKNLNTAKKINQLVNKLIPFSDNYRQRSRIFALNSPYTPDSLLPLTTIVGNSLRCLRKITSSDDNLEYNVNKILEYKTGNCKEKSCVGYYFGVEGCPSVGLEGNAPVEWVKLAGIDEKTKADHLFLIIGRNREIPLSDYKRWAVDPVVLGDPWTGAFYPASEIDQYLMDYVGGKEFNDERFSIVKKFDPSIYTIKLVLSDKTEENRILQRALQGENDDIEHPNRWI